MLTGADRLIVALDVSTHDEAVSLVDRLPQVSFFKIGLRLFLAGDLYGLLSRLQARRRGTGGVFVDLKLAGDIGNTISDLVLESHRLGIRFMTFVESVPEAITRQTLRTVRETRRDDMPLALMVPYLSSLGSQQLQESGQRASVEDFILERGGRLLAAGCDGLIVSGEAIGACREHFPDALLVSPGIRPAGAALDDHARSTTPGRALHLGADYLVVGRPITAAPTPAEAAQRIIDEMEEALAAASGSAERSA